MPTFRDDKVETWKSALDDALDFRREYGREEQWAKCEALFYNADQSQQSNQVPNIVYSTGDALLSTLLVPNPHYIVKPSSFDLVDACPVLETQLNNFISTLGLKEEFEQASLHAYLCGQGILKLGYDSEFGYDPSQDIGRSAQTITGMTLSQFSPKGTRIEYDKNITPGMPWCKSVHPIDFLVPWGTSINLRSAPWCAQRIVRHIDDIKADPKYTNKKDLQPMLSMSDYVKSYTKVMKPYRMGSEWGTGRREGGDKMEYVEMWEIHDARTGRVYVVDQMHDKFLRNDIDYLQEDGLPYVSLAFVPKARTFWTTPDAVYLQSHQEEAIDIAAIQRRQRRISLLRFMYKKGAIKRDELVKFFSGEIGIGIEIDEVMSENPITAMTPSNNNNQLQVEAEAIRRDARETAGFSRNQMGEYEASGRRTAAEATIVQQNADQRLNRRTSNLAEAYKDVGKKLARIIFKFWKTPRIVQTIGQDGAAAWMSFTGTVLKGDYEYKVGFSSEPIEGIKARQQSAIQVIQALGVFQALMADPTIDQIEIRKFFARAFNDPEITKLFKPGLVDNANLRLLMQQMQAGMGSVAAQGDIGGGGPGSVRQLPQSSVSGVQRPAPAG